MAHRSAAHRSPEMNACIESCSACHGICVETIAHCLVRGGPHATPNHLGLLQVCADMSGVAADAMRHGIDEHIHTCRACAAVASACAESCESVGSDAEMERCIEACRRCAEDCNRMTA